MIEGEQEGGEPGSPALSRVFGVIVVLLILAVAVMQQVQVWSPPTPPEPGKLVEPEAQFEMASKVLVKWAEMGRRDAALAASLDPVVTGQLDGLRAEVRTPEDRLRFAVVTAEIVGAEQGLHELGEVQVPADKPALARDADVTRRLLQHEPVSEDDAAALRENHGWYGRLALVVDKPDDPERQAVVGGGLAILTLVGLGIAVAFAAVLAGFVLFIVGLVKWLTGTLRLHFVPLPPGGSALIETVAVFIVAFIVLKIIAELVSLAVPSAAMGFSLAAQWLVMLAAFWPVLRGMPKGAAAHALGLHRGRGFFREVGAGIVGYLACLPILVAGVISIIVLQVVVEVIRRHYHQSDPGAGRNAVLEIVSGATSPWLLVAIFLLATVWAPLMEELVFRGALFGHLRKRWGVLASALLVAPAFGLMHGYPLLQLGGVISLGFGFSLLREWRGSLIAPMTAHCIHNTALLSFLLLLFHLLG